VEDNHHGLVSSYFALKAIKELGITPPGRAGMVLVADEETGSGHGLEHVLKTRPDAFSPADLIVVPDGGDQSGGLIEVTEKSIYWLKVEVNGRQTHGASPHQGVNALMAAARMMTATREVLAGFPQTDQRFGLPHSTMEPTRIEEGVANVNTIPGRAVFYLDCRLLPEIPLDEVAAALRQSFEAMRKAISNLTARISNIFADGEYVCVEYMISGAFTGPMSLPTGTIQPTGRKGEVPYCDVYQLRNGKITGVRTYSDSATMARQIGLTFGSQKAA
jgi:acetylornithine deacetylase/succinyl-diaminopimelate desuccinylase-like protein